ncbi:hypothetical protein BP6252_00560 [Coleophoma cylindrospora]|uniref:Chromosome condensation protein n=1 Tax=Coleophoma cylindrospora TaxID=1849047 RepID=A0A3D8SRZ3_9HELO|nr:hypothetical protein BP6252_00560 [Coleophoma cylindrospora]
MDNHQPSVPRPGRLRRSSTSYNALDDYQNLDELAVPAPVLDPGEERLRTVGSLENRNDEDKEGNGRLDAQPTSTASAEGTGSDYDVSGAATHLYTVSYLIFFSLLGTLARLGLQAITFYPGAPIVFSEVWANFGGCLIFGFLSEDRMLFKHEWGTATYDQAIARAKVRQHDEEDGASFEKPDEIIAAKKAHAATKKTIPLFVGLATGFCGSFTSFSSFIRDAFLALSNHLPTPLDHPADYTLSSTTSSTVSRDGGYSFMALLAVLIITVALCMAALQFGAHLAILSEPHTPSLPFLPARKVVDPIFVFLAWGSWLGAILLAIFPPDAVTWRGRAVFALVFAPVGCLIRFYASLFLNRRIASFPLGTFVVNIFGTMILGLSYDLQHVPLGGVIGCQVLQGIEDGFCGCLTTVSTWIGELDGLRRSNAYRYGTASVVVALSSLIVIMGSMQWTVGFSALVCTK